MSAYFIASTGTGVGKTFTTCALLHAARQRFVQAQGYKPVLSGWQEETAATDSDVAEIIAAGGAPRAFDEVSPWRFAAPLSPHRAAALEGRSIDMVALAGWTEQAKASDGLTLIETVGGVMVPLTDQKTTLDWMEQAKLPVLLVVGSYLGTISHTLTALAALRARNIAVAALVVNASECSAVTLAETVAGLAPYTSDIALRIAQPRVSSWREAGETGNMLEKLL